MNVIMYILVALAICIVLLTLEMSRNKRKLRDLKWRFEATDRFIDRCHNKIAQLIHELQVLEGNQSKMSDELLKTNDLDSRLNALQDDFTDFSRDFKALTTLGSTQPYTPIGSQIFYGLDGTQVNNKEEE